MDESRRRGRRLLLIVAAIFLLPVLAAFALYYGKLWRPSGSASKGELIQPARPLAVSGLKQADGSPASGDVLTGKWSIVYVGDGACDADCRTALVFARQSRLALNNEMTRVQRVFLATGNCCATAYFSAEQPGLIALDASAPEAQALLGQFPGEPAELLVHRRPARQSHDAARRGAHQQGPADRSQEAAQAVAHWLTAL